MAAEGNGRTTALVVAGTEAHPPTVIVTEYRPEAEGAAEGIWGFCSADVKPPGPVQLYVAPATSEAVSCSVCPSQIGPLFPASGGRQAPDSRKITPPRPEPPPMVDP